MSLRSPEYNYTKIVHEPAPTQTHLVQTRERLGWLTLPPENSTILRASFTKAAPAGSATGGEPPYGFPLTVPNLRRHQATAALVTKHLS